MIIQDGLRRMYGEQEDVFYYITLMNENYEHPAHAGGCAGRHPQGHVSATPDRRRKRRRACSCSAAAPSCAKSSRRAELLENEFGVAADIWSCPSFTELRREGLEVERWNLLHPDQPPRKSYVEQCLAGREGPGDRVDRLHEGLRRPDPSVRAAAATACSERMGSADRTTAASCARSSRWTATMSRSRRCKALAEEGKVKPSVVADAIRKFGIDPRSQARLRSETGALRQNQPATPAQEAARAETRERHVAATEVKVPDIGDFKDVPIIEIHVKPGDAVNAEDPLLTLESDKATMDVPAPQRAAQWRRCWSRWATGSARARR